MSNEKEKKTGKRKIPQEGRLKQPEVMTIRSGMRTGSSSSHGGSQKHASHVMEEDELRRMQNRQMKKRQAIEAKRRRKRKERRNFKIFYWGVAAVCLCLAIVAVSRFDNFFGKENKLQTENSQIQESLKPTLDGNIPAKEEELSETQKSWTDNLPDIGAVYGIYVNQIGWSHFFSDNSYCMAPVNQVITGVRATVYNQPEDMTGTIGYRVNLSGTGWLDWVEDAGESGNSSGNMPLEALCMRLNGELGENYDILYSVLQNHQWTDWVKNGEEAGTCGVGLRIDGIRVSIVKKKENQESYAGNIDPSKPMIALTYDDGPSAHATPRILAKLKEYHSRATFFMVGKQAEKRMDVIKQMKEQGCEVANHTYDHTLMTKVPPEELASQLARTNQVISDACGVSPVLMRPCGGARSEAGMNIVGAISMPAVLWSIDTLDWKTKDPQTTIKTVLEQVKDGDIVLMHDLYEATADASDVLIPELVNRGYQLVTVSELASYRGGMIPGQTYSRFRPVAVKQ